MYDIKKTYNAKTVDETVILLSENPGAVLLCGGTDVMIRLKARKLKDATLIYIREIPELNGVRIEADGTIVIGAATCFDYIYRDEICRRYIPILSYACKTVGSPQIRNIGTIGGNICNGAVSADSIPSLYSLDAILEVKSIRGSREIPVTEFNTGPGKTVLAADEILTAIKISKENYEGFGGCYIKFGQRNSMEISTLGCAATIRFSADGSTVEKLRIAFGVAAPVPVRCRKLEEAVSGKQYGDAMLDFISNNVIAELNPRDSWRASKELREQLIKTLAARAVRQAASEAGRN